MAKTSTHLPTPEGWKAELDWVAGYVVRQFTCPKAVIHSITSDVDKDWTVDMQGQEQGQGQGPSLQGPGQGQGLDLQGQGQGLDSQGPGQGQGLHLQLLTASCS